MLLSIVLPVYNEQEVLPALFAALPPVLEKIGCSYELIFIDDGSRDSTRSILNEHAAKDDRVKVLAFSRNFGQQAAITAGLDFANGDAVVVMDADLQDPPELLETMVEQFKKGFDVVSTQRISREGESIFKNDIFSEPEPLGSKRISNSSLSLTKSTWTSGIPSPRLF
jgi:dolichol-phosphate mannosyltransferase